MGGKLAVDHAFGDEMRIWHREGGKLAVDRAFRDEMRICHLWP